MHEDWPEIAATFQQAQERLVLQASDLSLETIASMVAAGAIDLAPHYQRRERWDVERQSALIESFILNIPVPPIYLAEEEYGKYAVIDGKQRITSIHEFMKKGLRIHKPEGFEKLQGKKFDDLPPEIQNALRIRPYVRVITLLRQTAAELRYEVFTRLNRGGEPLLPQELRNVAFRGPLNDLIYSLGTHPFLRKQLKIEDHKSSAYKTMQDAEFVLRFLTLEPIWSSFKGSLVRSMDAFMRDNRNATHATLGQLSLKFERAIEGCQLIWGDNAFKRPAENGWRDQLIAGMYDAQMIVAAMLSSGEIVSASGKKAKIRAETKKLFDADQRFDEAVRLGTNTPARIKYRVEKLRDLVRGLI